MEKPAVKPAQPELFFSSPEPYPKLKQHLIAHPVNGNA